VVRFDALSDSRFLPSLQDMGTGTQIEVLRLLNDIAEKHYSWQQFIDNYGWQPLNLVGPDTFPGANALHQFVIHATSARQYTVVGYTHENVVVVCAIARKS
jgi:hypothetical protein